MSLTLIATPIGNSDDITLRALNNLRDCDFIIGEELKVLRRRLSSWDVAFKEKTLLTLNEHTNESELEELLNLCTLHEVSLVSDCGTPSFFDPGFSLVKLCRMNNVDVRSLPGVSSLTALIPYLPVKTERFDVLGFPPKKDQDRKHFFNSLKKNICPFFLMDTPYRIQKTLEEVYMHLPKSSVVLGVNLTCENEYVFQGPIEECLHKTSSIKKENFVLMIYPRGF